ncbi:MAG: agmatinase [bacterium]
MSDHFAGLTKKFSQYETSKIVILPIAFDKSVSWLKGAAKGPKAIITASQQVELYDIETETEVYKHGIFTNQPIKGEISKKMIAQAYKKTSCFLRDKKFVVTLGGDHSVAIGPIIAHKDFYKNISILHLDAHADLRESYENNKFSHASVMARAREKVNNIVSVGIRSMDVSERPIFKRGNLFLAEDICCSNNQWIFQVIKKLSGKVYLSLDVDVFDSGLIPSTGTPEPGGLNWYQVISLIRTVCKEKEIVGMDIVELAPTPTNKAPDFLVAKLIYKILSYKFATVNGIIA